MNNHYICINSSDRGSAYKKTNHYKIYLDTVLKDIKSIELVNCSIPNVNNVQDLPYLILKIDGIPNIVFGGTSKAQGFCLLYMKNTTGNFIQCELGVLQRNVKYFKNHEGKLSSLEVQILKPNGDLFDFGEADGDVTVANSNSFLFRVITEA